jgi:hypothetical protein
LRAWISASSRLQVSLLLLGQPPVDLELLLAGAARADPADPAGAHDALQVVHIARSRG